MAFVNFWNSRWRYSSRTLKNSNPLKTSLSESYHSSHITVHLTNLTLLDAAYRDTAVAISMGGSLELFGEGFKC